MKHLFAFLFCSLIFSCNFSHAQKLNDLRLLDKRTANDDRFFFYNNTYNDTTDECDINLDNSILLKNVRIIGAADSVFTITKESADRSFAIPQIKSIKFIKHGFAAGMIYGVLASTVFWGVLGLSTPKGSEGWSIGAFGFVIGFVLGIPTGIITGIITEFATQDDIYDFGKINSAVKLNRLKYIMREHKSN